VAKKKLIKKKAKKKTRKKRAVKKKKKKASRGRTPPEPVAVDDGDDELADDQGVGDDGIDEPVAGTFCEVCEEAHAAPPCDPPEGAAEAEEDEEALAPNPVKRRPHDLGGSSERGRSRISALASEMGRTWGTHTAMPMDVAPVVNIMRMPIGIIEFDYRTGGGLVIGRNNRIDGKKDTLKSTMCLRALRAAQKTCRHCVTGDTVVQGRVRSIQRMRYTGEIVKVTTESGRTLTLTPNHRVVAAHAFVCAGELEPGQNLLRHIGQDVRDSSIPMGVEEQHEYHEPISIEKMFGAMAERFGTVTDRVGANDFNGDAAFGDGQVEVVTIDGELPLSGDAEYFQRVEKPVLVVSPVGAAAPYPSEVMRTSGLRDFSVGALATSDSIPGFPALGTDDVGVVAAAPESVPFELARFGPASNMDAPFLEPDTYDPACHTEFVSDLLGSATGEVTLDKIIDIDRYPFSGHVYDLHTDVGWMLASDMVISNCKWRLVTDPHTGTVNCHCPPIRYWVANEDDYCWLPQEAAINLYHGHLPEGSKNVAVKGKGRMPALVCDPPPHLKGKRGIKRRPIPFKEDYRCEPMRCVFVDTEGTVDRKWAEANGVDPALVLLVGGKWAEQCLEAAERTMLSREFDFIVIDSTSMLETREHLEDRKVGERGTPAGKQKIMGDFIKRVVAAQAEEGLAGRYRPTLLTTSHLTTKGMGYGQHTYMGPTDGNTYAHGVAMDIRMKADRFIFDADKQKAIRGEFTFTITKNHCGGMGSTKTSGQIKFWLIDTPNHPVGDSNDLATVITYARTFGDGYIVKRGSNLVLQSDMIDGTRKVFRTLTRLREYLQEHDTVYDDLRHRVLAKLIEDRASLVVAEAEEPEGVSA